MFTLLICTPHPLSSVLASNSFGFSHYPLCMSYLDNISYQLMDTLVSTSLPYWGPCSHFYSFSESLILAHHDLESEPHVLFFFIFLAIRKEGSTTFIPCDCQFLWGYCYKTSLGFFLPSSSLDFPIIHFHLVFYPFLGEPLQWMVLLANLLSSFYHE